MLAYEAHELSVIGVLCAVVVAELEASHVVIREHQAESKERRARKSAAKPR